MDIKLHKKITRIGINVLKIETTTNSDITIMIIIVYKWWSRVAIRTPMHYLKEVTIIFNLRGLIIIYPGQ